MHLVLVMKIRRQIVLAVLLVGILLANAAGVCAAVMTPGSASAHPCCPAKKAPCCKLSAGTNLPVVKSEVTPAMPLIAPTAIETVEQMLTSATQPAQPVTSYSSSHRYLKFHQFLI